MVAYMWHTGTGGLLEGLEVEAKEERRQDRALRRRFAGRAWKQRASRCGTQERAPLESTKKGGSRAARRGKTVLSPRSSVAVVGRLA